MVRGVERVGECVIGEEREGELSVMLSVCGAGCDKRGGIQPGISLPSLFCLSVTHSLTHTHPYNQGSGGKGDSVGFSSTTHE